MRYTLKEIWHKYMYKQSKMLTIQKNRITIQLYNRSKQTIWRKEAKSSGWIMRYRPLKRYDINICINNPKCKKQKNRRTVAQTTVYHREHLWTPRNQMWDQGPERRKQIPVSQRMYFRYICRTPNMKRDFYQDVYTILRIMVWHSGRLRTQMKIIHKFIQLIS